MTKCIFFLNTSIFFSFKVIGLYHYNALPNHALPNYFYKSGVMWQNDATLLCECKIVLLQHLDLSLIHVTKCKCICQSLDLKQLNNLVQPDVTSSCCSRGSLNFAFSPNSSKESTRFCSLATNSIRSDENVAKVNELALS